MKLKQAIKMIESEHKIIYPEKVKLIEARIKRLLKKGMKDKALQWQAVLKSNHQRWFF